jgi:hypothetical protein
MRKVDFVLLSTDAVYQDDVGMWNVNAGEVKYVRDVRGVRMTR